MSRPLIRLLQKAYSGEKAAALAYQGHARSVSDLEERETILRIEAEEWVHRAKVGAMLERLGARPVAWRERVFGAIGRTLSVLCPVSGYVLPMFFAWRLEVANVHEYASAARHAEAAGLDATARELHAMAATEQEHVDFFRACLDSRAPAPARTRAG